MSTLEDAIALFQRTRHAVISTLAAADGAPQSAVVGIAVAAHATCGLELVFDTVDTSRKYANLARDPRISLTAWHDEVTVQLEGRAEVGVADDRIRNLYFATFPDGPDRLAWAGITHVRVVPAWLRYSDFASGRIEEWRAAR